MENQNAKLDVGDWGVFYEVINNFLTNKYDKLNKLPSEKLFVDLIYHISGITEMKLSQETCRQTNLVWARYIHIYIHHKLYKFPLSPHHSKNLLYGKDHSTCCAAIKKVNELIKVNHEFRKKYAVIWVLWNQYNIEFPAEFPINSVKNLFL